MGVLHPAIVRGMTTTALDISDCTCVVSCDEDPDSACSLSGINHVHPDDGSGTFGPCPLHPDAPGDV